MRVIAAIASAVEASHSHFHPSTMMFASSTLLIREVKKLIEEFDLERNAEVRLPK